MSRVDSFSLTMKGFEQSPRKIWVYLPDSYDSHPEHPYDVLYMFDGHNLFFDEVATYGKSWGIKDYLDQTHLDLVVVGQDCNHTGNHRLKEYCPYPSDRNGWEIIDDVSGDRTAEWFVHTLKPEIEKNYHVSKDREHCAIGGSSMGGLMSDYMAIRYSHVYSGFASISPATQFCLNDLLHLLHTEDIVKGTKVYRSVGSEEADSQDHKLHMMDSMLNFSNELTDYGYTVHNRLGVGLSHSEASWETLVPEFLFFLFPHLY